jgi:hypothetical protein
MGFFYATCLLCGCGFINEYIVTNINYIKKYCDIDSLIITLEFSDIDHIIGNCSDKFSDETIINDIEKTYDSEKLFDQYNWLNHAIAIVPSGIVNITEIYYGDINTFYDDKNIEYTYYNYKKQPKDTIFAYLVYPTCCKLCLENGINVTYDNLSKYSTEFILTPK